MSDRTVIRTLGWCVAACAAVVVGTAARAQPTSFVNLGSVTPPATPYEFVYVEADALVPFQNPPLALSVRWARLEIGAPITGETFLDIDGRNYNQVPVTFALYDNAGNFIAADDTDGTVPPGTWPALSFGATRERVPYGPGAGQDGGLGAGVYWFAIVAGARSAITFGPNWGISTASTLNVGFEEGELFLEIGVKVGNTIPPPVPANDNCAGAVTIGDNSGGGSIPAWTGTSVGASLDATSSCYFADTGFTYKDVWLRYVPTFTGWVTINASQVGSGIPPLLTRYEGECGSAQVRCAGGGSFLSAVGTRLTFEVTAGTPVLMSMAAWAGDWGTLALDVRPVGPPCDLGTPATAVPEIEAACGDASNDGCAGSTPGFDLIQLGETVRGTLYNTRTFRDTDVYLLRVPQGTNVRVTAAAQLPFDLVVRSVSASTGCPATRIVNGSSLSYQDVCDPITLTFTGGGEYAITIGHTARDDFFCDSGYTGYWLSAVDTACAYAVFSTQPAGVDACPGGTATFAAQTTGPTPSGRGWEWERVTGGVSEWRAVVNGTFVDAGSAAVVSGATTGTLVLTGVDAAAAVRFRATAQTCGAAISRPATLRLGAGGACTCPADFNGVGGLSVQDIFDFLTAWFENDPRANFNGAGGVTVQDVFDYLGAFFQGC